VGGLATAVALATLEAVALATTGSLPVLPGALGVVRHSSATTASVEYDIREQYPARQTIGLLVDAMAKGGWKLGEVGGFKGSWPEPTDWPTAPGMKRAWPTHVWRGRWQAADGREAELRLTYSCPMERAGMHSVWVRVSGVVYGPKEAALRNAAHRRILKECEAGQTVSPECEK
jgi:hypothetical protein